MKKIVDRIKNEPMLVVFVIILLFFTPQALFSAGESNLSAMVTAIGVDLVDNEYEVSLLTFIPTPNQTYLETDSVITGKGETVAKAITNAELTLGKKVGLSHAKTTVVSFKVLEENVAKEIDYLSRVASLSENTVLICTDESAKELLLASQKLEKDVGLKLEQLISYNIQNIYITDTTLEAFYKGYYSKNGSSILGFLTLEESEGQNSESAGSEGGSASYSSSSAGSSGKEAGGSSGGSSGGNSGGSSGSGGGAGKASSGGSSTKQIKNGGDIVLLKKGKMVAKLTETQLEGINLINPTAKDQVITIDYQGGDQPFSDAVLTYKVNTKRVMTTTKFENGNPIFAANVMLGMDLVESKKVDGAVKNNTDLSEIPEPVALQLELEIKKNFAEALEVLRKNKTDVIGVRDKFERENRKQFRKFLDGLDDPDDYLNHINFQLVVRVQPD